MLVWVAAVLLEGGVRSLKPFHICFLLFILWNAASIFWTIDEDATLERISTWFQLGILVILIWDLLTNRTLLKTGMQAFVAGALVAACGIIFNFINSTEFVYGRYSAGGQHAVNLGLMMAIGLPMAWYLILDNQIEDRFLKWFKWLNILFFPIVGIAIALTGSRGAMIAAFPAIIFILSTASRLPLWAKLASAIAACGGIYVALLIVPESLFRRLGSAYTELQTGGSLTGRTQIWSDATNRFLDNPILGVGSNAFKSISEHGLVVHNSFLSVFVETGILGGLLFLTTIALALLTVLSLPKLESRLWLAVFFAWFLGASALTFEHQKTTWLVLALMAAAMVLAQRNRANEH